MMMMKLACTSQVFAAELLASDRAMLLLLTRMRGGHVEFAADAASALAGALLFTADVPEGQQAAVHHGLVGSRQIRRMQLMDTLAARFLAGLIRSMAARICACTATQRNADASLMVECLAYAIYPVDAVDADDTDAAANAALAAEAAARTRLLPALVRISKDAMRLQQRSSTTQGVGHHAFSLLYRLFAYANRCGNAGLLRRLCETRGLAAFLAEALGENKVRHGALTVNAARMLHIAATKGGSACPAALCAEPWLLPKLALGARWLQAEGAAAAEAEGWDLEVAREDRARVTEALEVLCSSCGTDPSACVRDFLQAREDEVLEAIDIEINAAAPQTDARRGQARQWQGRVQRVRQAGAGRCREAAHLQPLPQAGPALLRH